MQELQGQRDFVQKWKYLAFHYIIKYLLSLTKSRLMGKRGRLFCASFTAGSKIPLREL